MVKYPTEAIILHTFGVQAFVSPLTWNPQTRAGPRIPGLRHEKAEVGMKPESAYYESLHETPLIANTIARKPPGYDPSGFFYFFRGGGALWRGSVK